MRPPGEGRAIIAGFFSILMGGWLTWLYVIRPIVTSDEVGYEGGILLWLVTCGLAGLIGGIFFLLSIGGPVRFRTRRVRQGAWVAMLVGALIPSIAALPVIFFVALAGPYSATQPVIPTADPTQ